MASEVTVDLEDLRTLLIRAEKAFCTLENKHDPIVGVIDRLGDKVCVVGMRNAIEERKSRG